MVPSKTTKKARTQLRAKPPPRRRPAAKATTKPKTRKTPQDTTSRAYLSAKRLAQLLDVPAAVIEAHVAAGAPTDAGRRLHILEYAAWLITREVEHYGRRSDSP